MSDKYFLIILCLKDDKKPIDFVVPLDSPPDAQICPLGEVQTDWICLKHNMTKELSREKPHAKSHQSESVVICLPFNTNPEGLIERALEKAETIFRTGNKERV